MKRFLAVTALLLAGMVPLHATPTPAAQTKALYKTLWQVQKQAGLEDTWISVDVLPEAQMREKGAWGLVYADDKGFHIQVLAAQDYPKDFPPKEIAKQQRRVISHEVMHIIFTAHNMPDQSQDEFIGAVLPMLNVK